MAHRVTLVGVVLVLALVALPARANALTITFETLTELDSVTTQFHGLIVQNATVLSAGSLLNETETPPKSGVNAIFDDGSPIRIDFTSPILGFGGYFTYYAPLTLSAFDAASTPLGSVSSFFASNTLLTGDFGSTPNEFLQILAPNIAYVTIEGLLDGGSFIADDLTISAVPEPRAFALLLLGGAATMICRRVRRNTSR